MEEEELTQQARVVFVDPHVFVVAVVPRIDSVACVCAENAWVAVTDAGILLLALHTRCMLYVPGDRGKECQH